MKEAGERDVNAGKEYDARTLTAMGFAEDAAHRSYEMNSSTVVTRGGV